MLRRAKTSVLFILVGALTASGALLNPQERKVVFQPGSSSRVQPAVMRPADATVAFPRWSGGRVQPVAPGLLSPVRAPVAVNKTGGGQ